MSIENLKKKQNLYYKLKLNIKYSNIQIITNNNFARDQSLFGI